VKLFRINLSGREQHRLKLFWWSCEPRHGACRHIDGKYEYLYSKRAFILKNLFLIATAIAAVGSAATTHADASDLHFPTFELTGFPISPHQVAVLGGAQVEERTATPTLMLADMPASLHQIGVLTPRAKTLKIVEASTEPILPTVALERLWLAEKQ